MSLMNKFSYDPHIKLSARRELGHRSVRFLHAPHPLEQFVMFRFVVFVAAIASVRSARILCMFPTPAYSHQMVFRSYTQALIERGHTLTVITPTPLNAKNSANLTEIDISNSHTHYKQLVDQSKLYKKRGIIADVESVNHRNYLGLVRMVSEQFRNERVGELLRADRDTNRFDLIVTEAFIDFPLILSHFYDAPVIQMSSGHGLAENFETMGAVSRHPIYYPNVWRDTFPSSSNVWQMANELYRELVLYREFALLADEEDKMLKRQFGRHVPGVRALRNNVQMLLLNTHAMFDNNRPVSPSVQYLGGIHLKKQSNIMNSHLSQFLDDSTMGVVYVSFGSGVHALDMDDEFLHVFLSTFRSLPYNILWKADSVNDTLLPGNVLVQKWFPQQDVLNHRNVRVFVTHGGIQSTDEAIDAQVPLVGLPLMGDQFFNVAKFQELGIGRALNAHTVDAAELIEAILDANENPAYKRNLARVKRIILDQPMKPLEKAVWYTEHVIRHGGAAHLKTRASNVAWYEYLMVNALVPVVVSAFIGCFGTYSKYTLGLSHIYYYAIF
ncbi:egt [Leucania separata nucleopolyhedrovirus]|uniref:Ecdysteroid UDP-glucosyltransferase n=1 Tax=Leucania separata nucleopolyhedrovirus TaxID=1307956 RepID=Q0IKX4_NPVLS|nr:egt [Leucania separata nucleopolyhedrovirus]AAR28909.1 egt [Leucania separata nucleopolyhedrovirus]